MEKINIRVLNEELTIHQAFHEEMSAVSEDSDYSRYHSYYGDLAMYLGNRYNDILNYKGQTKEDLIAYVSSLQLTDEQKKELVELRKSPIFKKIMGQKALIQKPEIENVLGVKITSQGMTIADEKNLRQSVKEEVVLDKELIDFSDKVSTLFYSGQITQEQYDSYSQSLFYIYDYYMSQSRGEQIPYRKISDSEYINIENMADDNGITLKEQMAKINEDLLYDFKEVQEVSGIASKR